MAIRNPSMDSFSVIVLISLTGNLISISSMYFDYTAPQILLEFRPYAFCVCPCPAVACTSICLGVGRKRPPDDQPARHRGRNVQAAGIHERFTRARHL